MRLFLTLLFALTASPAWAEPVTGSITAVAAWYAGLDVVAQIAVQIGISLAISAVSFGISYLLSGSGKSNAAAKEGPSVSIPERAGLLTRRRVYGTYTVNGAVFFQKTVADTLSSVPDVFVYGVAVSEGVCDSLEALVINGVECALDSSGNPRTAPWFDGSIAYLKASFRSGAADQAMDSIIAARFPSPPADFWPDLGSSERATRWAKFRQKGIATVVVEIKFGGSVDHHTELWGAGGVPNLQFKVRGLRVYDPRDPSHDPDDSSTWGWSDNATLCEQDWLNANMGFGIAWDEIDTATNAQSARFDADYISTLDGLEQRGRVNGEVFASEANADVLSQMALQNRAIVTRAGGVYSIRPERAADPVATLHMGLLVGDLAFENEPDIRAAINTVNVEFHPAAAFHESGEVSYSDAALQTADGQVLEQRLQLRFCDSPAAAQRLGYATLTENRAGRTMSAVLDIACLVAPGKSNRLLEKGDCVRVVLPSPYTAAGGIYRVNSLDVNGDFTVSVQLSGTDPNIIDGWTVDLETEFVLAA